MTRIDQLPSYHHLTELMAAAEEGDGWLDNCQQQGRFLVLNRQFVRALARLLFSMDNGPILEICAGQGELAAALAAEGVSITATDVAPPQGCSVIRAEASEALRRYQPAVVLGSFVPCDAGVDSAVLAYPSVARYVMLNARIGGKIGCPALWTHPSWRATPLLPINRWMICRHDVWMGPGWPMLQHAEAWLLRRSASESEVS